MCEKHICEWWWVINYLSPLSHETIWVLYHIGPDVKTHSMKFYFVTWLLGFLVCKQPIFHRSYHCHLLIQTIYPSSNWHLRSKPTKNTICQPVQTGESFYIYAERMRFKEESEWFETARQQFISKARSF